jgi:cytochrome c553
VGSAFASPHPLASLGTSRFGGGGKLGRLGASAAAQRHAPAGRRRCSARPATASTALSKMPESPKHRGQSPSSIWCVQLNAFRKGERKNEMMSVVVQQLSDQDVADLAAYYAAIEGER